MRTAYDAYLQDLRRVLRPLSPDLAETLQREVQQRLDLHLDRLAWEAAHLPPEEAWARTLAEVGSPFEAVERILAREGLGGSVRLPPAPVPAPSPAPEVPRPWPAYLSILREPEAYTSLLYLALCSLTGTFYLLWITSTLSVSLGLLILLVGLPLLLLTLASVRALGQWEHRLVRSLLGTRMPEPPPILPPVRGLWAKLGALLTDGDTWRSLLYLGMMLPLGMVYLGLLALAFGTSLALASTPVALMVAARLGASVEGVITLGPGLSYGLVSAPAWLTVGISFLGLLSLVGCLHLALALGRAHGRLARVLLG